MKKIVRMCTVVFLVSCLAVFTVAAQKAEFTVYDRIDDAFMTKSPDNVRELLETERESSEYPKIEEYVLKKSRGLLISNQLELIQEMTMAIIDNNLDCQDAVNLYIIVERAIDKRDAALEPEKAQAAAEAEYVASVSEEEKEKAKKAFNTIENVQTGESVYVNAAASRYYAPITWDFSMLFGDLGIFTGDNINLKMGLGAKGSVFFHDDRFSLGLNVYADNLLISFAEGQPNNWVLDLIPAISYVALNEDLYLRTGFTLQRDEGNNFFSPVLGVGMNVPLSGINSASWYVDYYPAHLTYLYKMAFSGGAGASMSFGLSRVGSNVLSLNMGLRENIIIKNGGIKSRTRLNIGFGVGCNE